MISFFAQHVYFLSAFLFSLLWIIVFFLNKDNRKQMIYMSLSTMILGFFVEQMHFTDWWQPHFIFDSYIKIEDVLFGFGAGGVISGIYSILQSKLKNNFILQFNLSSKVFLIFSMLFSLFGLFYIFHVHSFWSSVVALLIPVVVIAFKNTKSLSLIFLSSIMFTLIAFLGYLFAIYINPNFVAETYLLNHLSGVLFVGIPVEELIWFFFAGMGVPAVQELLFRKN